jgi:hypothetical protein
MTRKTKKPDPDQIKLKPDLPKSDPLSDEAMEAMRDAQKRLDDEVKLPPETEQEKHAGGRPTKYRPEFAEIAHKLTQALGATDKEVADFLSIDDATLYRWRHTHPEFCEALKVGKDVADQRVKQSLYRRAIGYKHDAVKVFNNNGEAMLVPFTEHYPPDTTAAIFWLKNRDPDQWRDKQDVEHSGKLTLEQLVTASMEKKDK